MEHHGRVAVHHEYMTHVCFFALIGLGLLHYNTMRNLYTADSGEWGCLSTSANLPWWPSHPSTSWHACHVFGWECLFKIGHWLFTQSAVIVLQSRQNFMSALFSMEATFLVIHDAQKILKSICSAFHDLCIPQKVSFLHEDNDACIEKINADKSMNHIEQMNVQHHTLYEWLESDREVVAIDLVS